MSERTFGHSEDLQCDAADEVRQVFTEAWKPSGTVTDDKHEYPGEHDRRSLRCWKQ